MRRAVMAGIACVVVSACRGASQGGEPVVARVGEAELTVARLAQIAAAATDVPLRPDVVEALAMRWVEYALLGQRTAAGDRLSERATIDDVAWPDVRAAVADSFRAVRLAGRLRVTPQQVDSAYRSGDARFLRQVLKRTAPAMGRAQRDSVRAVLEGIRRRLLAGGSWAETNEENDDPRARAENGDIGLMRRGQLVPAFARAAFALAPGQYSGIVQTDVGLHLIYRPTLDEARAALTAALKTAAAEPLDSLYRVDLLARNHVTLVPGVPAAVRFAVVFPFRARALDVPLVTYDGGRFTVGDLHRYLQFLPVAFGQQIQSAPDDQLVALVRSFVARELEWREAQQAGIRIPERRYRRIAEAYTAHVARILAATGLDPDSLARAAAEHSGRRQAAASRVARFLAAALSDPRLAVGLPPGLSAYLLDHGEWEVDQRGVDRALLAAAMLRSARRGPTARR